MPLTRLKPASANLNAKALVLTDFLVVEYTPITACGARVVVMLVAVPPNGFMRHWVLRMGIGLNTVAGAGAQSNPRFLFGIGAIATG